MPLRYRTKNPRKTLLERVKRKAQLYARLRDCSGRTGGVNCISCNKWHHFDDTDGGHFLPATNSSTMFDERNINAQCRQCNRFKHGNERNYYHGMVRKYGLDVVEELEAQEHVMKKWTLAELRDLDDYYTQKLNNYNS